MLAGNGVSTSTSLPAKVPIATPTKPPIVDTITASQRNCSRMVVLRAPSARRTPISRVRSFTETSRMFMIPMPPTMAVITPISAPTMLSASVIWLKPCSSLSCRLTEKLSS